MGQQLISTLQQLGFTVTEISGDLSKAYQVVYGSDPGDGGWSIYTEAWGGVFSIYNEGLAVSFYSPFEGNMPGWATPGYANYTNATLDQIGEKLVLGNFSSKAQRDDLLRQEVNLGIAESVRIFTVQGLDPYADS